MTKRHKPLPTRRVLVARLGRSMLTAGILITISLAIGMVGYHEIAHLGWLDAEYNAAMILTGMGPVDPMRTAAGKVFASGYALFSGVAFLSSVGVLVGPFVQHFLHRFHLEMEDTEDAPTPPRPGNR
jgi:hypothetical protein